jgi:Spy/CpxP family protein refolding chaperone
MFLRSTARFGLPIVLALAVPAFGPLGLLGCGGASASQSVSIPGATRAPVAQNTHGPVKVVGEALSDVPLTPQQRGDIAQLAAEADARHGATRAAERDLLGALAAQVQVGAIDRSALQPKIDAVVAATAQAQPADRAAIERLHSILGPDQRTAFVDALEARLAEHHGRWSGRHPMRELIKELKLSDTQLSQIKTVAKDSMRSMREGKGPGTWGLGEGWHRGAKVLHAFEQDHFVLDEVAPPIDVGKRATTMTDHFVTLASQVFPILTPEQRAIVARELRQRASL